MSSKSKKPSLDLHPLVRGAISNCMQKALKARPTTLHYGDEQHEVFEIDGEIYTIESAVEKICGEYSWWKIQK